MSLTLEEWRAKLDMLEKEKKNRIILIGQAPGQHGDPAEPLASKRLAKLAGMRMERYLESFERFNVLAAWPGHQENGKGDAWPEKEARHAAAVMEPVLAGRSVIFLGWNVADAFNFPFAKILTWYDYHGLFISYTAAVVPHPSGVNHWWNDPAHVRQAQKFLRKSFRMNQLKILQNNALQH